MGKMIRKDKKVEIIHEHLLKAKKKRKKTVYNLSGIPYKSFTDTNEDTNNQVPNLIKDIDIDNAVKNAISMLTRTKCDNSNNIQCNTSYTTYICVVCDTFII